MTTSEITSLQREVTRLRLLHKIGIALSVETNRNRLIETILLEAKKLCNADGGTLYLRTDDDHLRFAIVHTDSLGVALGGSSGKVIDAKELPPIALMEPDTGRPNHKNVASYAALINRSVNIPDAYDATGFDFSGMKAFDQRNGYRSKSFLTIPMVNGQSRVIGVLQLINSRDPATGELVPFSVEEQDVVEALASQAAVALDNQMLLEGQKVLLESFIEMIAGAIDSKSPYTGKHCERVPEITRMLVEAVCDCEEGVFAEFTLTEEQWYELRIASWLHDCGKVTTPVHVLDKATKLETIFDRIELVRARVEIVMRDLEIASLKAQLAQDSEGASLATARLASLKDDMAFIAEANVGAEFLSDDAKNRIRQIGQQTLMIGGVQQPLLAEEEIKNLVVSRGTLTDEERLVINGHMVETVRMLEALPFPRHLANVPEYAAGHHERMDGTGYPKGIYAGDMSVPARAMAIADVFEALTAQDRPYKKGKTLSEAMRIMGFMKRDNHLDPDLFDLFVQSGVYRTYGKRFLPTELIDEVDEASLIAIVPKSFDSPPEDARAVRWQDFLPEYRNFSLANLS